MDSRQVPVEIKGGPYHRTFVGSFKVDPELWSRFKEECKFRGTSICHVLEALIEAWIQGQKATATVIKPVTVNLTMEHVVQRPRRVLKEIPSDQMRWPPSCQYADDFIKSTKEVGCKERKDYVPLRECWRCWRLGRPGFGPGPGA